MNNRRLAFLYALLLCGILLAPYGFRFPYERRVNAVSWLPDRNGIDLYATGMIRSAEPPRQLSDALSTGTGLTVELWIQPRPGVQRGPARIFSYSRNKFLRNFTIGQEGEDLVIRLRTTRTDLNGRNPDFKVEDVFASSETRHLVVACDWETKSIYVDGVRVHEGSGPGGNFSNWDSSYPLVIGNEATGNRPWRGRVFLASVYGRALSPEEIELNHEAVMKFPASANPVGRVTDSLLVMYSFAAGEGDTIQDRAPSGLGVDLVIPPRLTITDGEFIPRPYGESVLDQPDWRSLLDALINLALFVPLGFLSSRGLQNSDRSSVEAVVASVLLGIVLTLSIEFLQFFIESRTSSLRDVVHNTLGAAMGAVTSLRRRREASM